MPAPLKEAGIFIILYNSKLERETGLEPATTTLGRWDSTIELFPQNSLALR